MKLIVGLGNPGKEYEETKHNIGFWVVDAFAGQHKVSLSEKKGDAIFGRGRWAGANEEIKFLLVKPQTFMNRSGRSVRAMLNLFPVSPPDLIVIYDDLDMPCGRVRLRSKGRSGGHRGVASVIDEIGTDQFIRLKIGIGRDPQSDPADQVLSPFHPDDKKLALSGVEKAVTLLPLLLEDRLTEAMNQYHTD
ncbi:MAG: aminoacyl-tRNA hydrolase [Nitrospira sp.]